MKRYKYFAQHMHMHSCYQPGASMEGHMYHAAKLGMKYIWFTDHDIRMGIKKFQVDGFDFEKEALFVEESGRSLGFKLLEENDLNCNVELTKETCFIGSQSLKISSYSDKDEWKGGGVYFWSSGKKHCSSLMAGMSLEIAAMLKENKDSRVIFDVRLSQRPPENECAHLLYVLGNTEGMRAGAHTAVIPLKAAEGWQNYTLNLSHDVIQRTAMEQGVGGLDNAFDTLSIIVEARKGSIEAYFDNMRIHVQEKFEPVRNVQKKVAKEKGEQYGITPFVATEISMAGPHKNCFSTSVPIIPYDEYGYKVTHEEAIAWVKRHGGIFALNHPFEKFKGVNLEESEKEEQLTRTTEEYMEHKAWGATLMEVGFPLGRGGFSVQMHLRLWDKLTEDGILLTGYGSSDNHSNQSGWYAGNNFCNWLGVASEEAEPVREETFVGAMRCGRCYMGNPVVLKGEVCFETEDGLPMGSVIMADSPKLCQNIRFYCDKARSDWKFRLVSNGQVVAEQLLGAECFEYEYVMYSEKLVNYVRAELYDENGVCIMLTNPIHIWRKDLGEITVPEERIFL